MLKATLNSEYLANALTLRLAGGYFRIVPSDSIIF